MPPASRYVTIEGQYASEVLGTFRVIRGFASLQDLATISAPFPMGASGEGGQTPAGHQRAIIPEHAASIKRYFQDGRPRFIPEIILSIRADFRDELDAQSRRVGVIGDAVAGLRIRRRWKNKALATHEIRIERIRLQALVQDERRIRRIDGNHRLHFANELTPDAHVPTKYLAPFCAILLGPPGDANDDYVEAMLFHTINSTGLRLDSEHGFQLILGQAAQYRPSADEELATDAPLHLTRLMKGRMDQMALPQRQRLGDTPATVLNASAKALIARHPAAAQTPQTIAVFAHDVVAALNDVLARLPPTFPELCKADFFIELASLAWSETYSAAGHDQRIDAMVSTLEGIGRWLGHEGLHKLESKRSMAAQLFEVFRSVRARVPRRVFLSRWNPSDADGPEKHKADLRKQMIDRTLDDLRAEDIDLDLDDPGTLVGGTFGIHHEMYTALARNDIILVDLSGVRPNVCIEAGYALKHYERGRLIILFQATDATPNNPAYARPPFDVNTFRIELIDDTGEIPGKLKPHFKEIWERARLGE